MVFHDFFTSFYGWHLLADNCVYAAFGVVELSTFYWVGCRLNEKMIETLFVVNKTSLKPKDATTDSLFHRPNQEERVLDPKKSQNISILLKALNVTVEEVCEALLEGIFPHSRLKL